jgi:phosphogluconate dehydratase
MPKARSGATELLEAEMASYHGPGTCTFYGTANSNQMLMEFMGLHLPGASFVNPARRLREALTEAPSGRWRSPRSATNSRPVCEILDERSFVNGDRRAACHGRLDQPHDPPDRHGAGAGIRLTWEDISDLSDAPLLARVYPNGPADVNHFHAAGGLGFMIDRAALGGAVARHRTVCGHGLSAYTKEAKLDGALMRSRLRRPSGDPKVVRPRTSPFQPNGGLKMLTGQSRQGRDQDFRGEAGALRGRGAGRVFHDQEGCRMPSRPAS